MTRPVPATPSVAGSRDDVATDPHSGRIVAAIGYLSLLAGQFQIPAVAFVPSLEVRLPALVVAGTAWLVWIAGQDRRSPFRNSTTGYALALAALAFYMCLSSLWAPPYSASAAGIEDVAYTGAFLFIAVMPVVTNPRLMPFVWRLLLWTGLAYAVVALAQGPDIQGRYAAFGGGPNVFVRVVLLGAIAAAVLALRENRTIYVWTIPLTLAGVILSGSRGGLVALAVSGAVIATYALVKHTGLALRGVILMAVAGGAVLALIGQQIGAVFQKRIITDTIAQGYSSGRSSLFEGALQQYLSAPVVGRGLGSYWGLIGRFIDFEYPHNILLLAGAEGGLVGVVLTVVVLAWPVLAGLPRTPMHIGALSAFLAIVSSAMFSGGIYDARFIWYFGLLTLLAAADRAGTPQGDALLVATSEHSVTSVPSPYTPARGSGAGPPQVPPARRRDAGVPSPLGRGFRSGRDLDVST